MKLSQSVLMFVLLFALGAEAKPPPGYRASAQILVDASASMKAPFGGESALKKTLEISLKAVESKGKPPVGVEVSWRSFGGGAGGEDASCEATQMLVPGGVTPGPPMRAATRDLAPRGPRPLSTGLDAAVADLPRDSQRQREVIIVTSGVDTCGRDVCLAATDLRQSLGLGNVRVIYVGSDVASAKKLACLGKVTTAAEAAAFEKQFPEALDAVYEPAQLTVSAMDGTKEVPGRVEFYAASDKVSSLSAETGQPLQVVAGVYQVRVIRGVEDEDAPRVNDGKHEGLKQNVELGAGAQLTLRVPLGGQKAKLTVNVTLNGQAPPNGTRISLFHAGDTETPIAGGAPGEPILLPPGRYDVRADIPGSGTGSIEVWKPEVTVAAGANQTVTLAAAQKLGKVKINVVSAGAVVEDATVALIHPNSRGEGEPLFNAGRELQFAPGSYKAVALVVTPVGEIRAVRDGVKVSSGGLTELTIDIGPSSTLQVNVAGRTINDSINVVVFRSGEMEPAGNLSAFGPHRLPSGKYDLRVDELMFQPPRSRWYKRITLAPGEAKVVNVTQ